MSTPTHGHPLSLKIPPRRRWTQVKDLEINTRSFPTQVSNLPESVGYDTLEFRIRHRMVNRIDMHAARLDHPDLLQIIIQLIPGGGALCCSGKGTDREFG
jgi:hypothetical protein